MQLPNAHQRETPVVWARDLAKILSGESDCIWSLWFRSKYHYVPRDSDFNFTQWRIDHTAILRDVRAEYEQQDYQIFQEKQNKFEMPGTVGIFTGKPDLVAIKGNTGIIVDAKAAKPSVAHSVQVMLYMWAVPWYFKRWRHIRFDGRVKYKTRDQMILADQLTEGFLTEVKKMLYTVCGEEPPPTVPSDFECRCCDVRLEDCEDHYTEPSDCEDGDINEDQQPMAF